MPELTRAQLDKIRSIAERLGTSATIQHRYFRNDRLRVIPTRYELSARGSVLMYAYIKVGVTYHEQIVHVKDYRFL